MEPTSYPDGNYQYGPGISPYSAGVRADDDYVIVRTVLNEPMPWAEGFETIDQVISRAGRPAQALCAVELRCPVPHSFGGFGSFNDDYRTALSQRGILLPDGTNPVARTNVAPMVGAADGTELHAFSYTAERARVLPTDGLAGPVRPSFVVAGAGDLNDQSDLRPEAIVGGTASWLESGPARASAVLDEMESRLAVLDVSWSDTDSVVVYSVERIGEAMESTVLPRIGAAGRGGVHWFHARPPIEGLLFEMDTRGGTIEQRI